MRLASGTEARVSEVTDDWITIDANHELAGKTLHYDVELLQLTKARCHSRGRPLIDTSSDYSAPSRLGCDPLFNRGRGPYLNETSTPSLYIQSASAVGLSDVIERRACKSW